MAGPEAGRIWEIDLVRGIAVVLMAVFHLIVDLKDFYQMPVEYLSGFWFYIGRSSAILFMFIAGVSSILNRRIVKHGLLVLAAGAVITVATYFFDPVLYVRFGILQFLGTSMLTVPAMRKIPNRYLAGIALMAILAGPVVRNITGHWLLLPFGIMPSGFRSMDYYPLLPWYGVFLLGMAAGRLGYADRKAKLKRIAGLDWLTWTGRHSLIIYLAHQPLLLALLYLIFAWR